MSKTLRALIASAALTVSFPLLAAPPTVGGCQIFPANHFWNTPIDQLPVDTVNSTNWVNSVNLQHTALHPDWGTTIDVGIPFVTVPGIQPKVPVTFAFADESDAGPYPIPPNIPVEGAPATGGDRHALVIETTNCKLYEIYRAFSVGGGTSWTADSGAIYDLNSNALRPDSWTSADAAGFAIFPGLVRYEEVLAGEIAHAIRFTAPQIWGSTGSGHKYIWPARHWSGNLNNPLLPPMGARFRLKASYDISGFDPRTQVILRAFKKYGLVLADGGSSWFIQGVSDPNWPAIVDSQLKTVPGNQFEVVNTALLQIDPNSALAVQVPGAPTGLVATGGNAQISIAFNAPPDNGSPIVTSPLYPAYKATCNPGAIIGTATASPVLVTGLTNGTAYACSIVAANVTGAGPPSASVNATPNLGVTLSSTAIDFGIIGYGEISDQVLTISNPGTAPIYCCGLAIAVDAGDPAVFDISQNVSQGIPPGGALNISVSVNTNNTAQLAILRARLFVTTSAGTATVAVSGVIADLPLPPSVTSVVAGNGKAQFHFTPLTPAESGGLPILSYNVTCTPGPVAASGLSSPITVILANDTQFTCLVQATNAYSRGYATQRIVTPSSNAPPTLVGLKSRKVHGAAGPFDVDIALPTSNGLTVEPRSIGSGHQLVFQFLVPITHPGTVGVVDAVTLLPVSGATSTASGDDIIVTLPTLADNKRVTFTLDGVNGLVAPMSATIGFLVGDANNTRSVNSSDISGVKARSGQATDATNFKFDVNVSGSVNSSDISAIKARSGLVLPP